MTEWRKPVAVYLWIVAAAVAFWFVFSPLLEDWIGGSFDAHAAWPILDPLSMLGAVVALIYTWHRKMVDEAGSDQSVTRDWLAHTVAFFVVAFLFVLLLGNYVIDTIVGAVESGGNRGLVWIIIDAGMPLAFLAVGTMMWRHNG